MSRTIIITLLMLWSIVLNSLVAEAQQSMLDIYQKENKWGLRDTLGTIMIAPIYNYLEHAFGSVYIAFETEKTLHFYDTLNVNEVAENLYFNKSFDGSLIPKENYKLVSIQDISENVLDYTLISDYKISIINQYGESLIPEKYDNYNYVENESLLILKGNEFNYVYKPEKNRYIIGHNYLVFSDMLKNSHIIINYNGEYHSKTCCPRDENISIAVYDSTNEYLYNIDTFIQKLSEYKYIEGGTFGIFNAETSKKLEPEYENVKVIFIDNSYFDNFYLHDVSSDTILSNATNIMDLFLVKNEKGWGLINSTGAKIIRPKFDILIPFKRNDSILFGGIFRNEFEFVFDAFGRPVSGVPNNLFKSQVFNRYNLYADTTFSISKLNVEKNTLIEVLEKIKSNEIKAIYNQKDETLDEAILKLKANGKVEDVVDHINFKYVIKSTDATYSNAEIFSYSTKFLMNPTLSAGTKNNILFEISSEDYIREFPILQYVIDLENYYLEHLDEIIKENTEGKNIN